MTSNEIKIVIAEACGIKDCGEREGCFRFSDGKGRNYSHVNDLPDYPNDLNAIHEAEKQLNSPQQRTYVEYLCKGFDGVRNQTVALYHATARQRAEAFIKTVCPEKWKD